MLLWVVFLVVVWPVKVASYLPSSSSQCLRHSSWLLLSSPSDNLEQLSRVELQRLAKENGIKANGKSAELIAQLQAQQLAIDTTVAANKAAIQKTETATRTLAATAAAVATTAPNVVLAAVSTVVVPPQEQASRCGVCTVEEEQAFVRYQQQEKRKRESAKAKRTGATRPEEPSSAAVTLPPPQQPQQPAEATEPSATNVLATIAVSPRPLSVPPSPPSPPVPPPTLQQLQQEQQQQQQQRLMSEQQGFARYRQQRVAETTQKREAATRRVETLRKEQWTRQDTGTVTEQLFSHLPKHGCSAHPFPPSFSYPPTPPPPHQPTHTYPLRS